MEKNSRLELYLENFPAHYAFVLSETNNCYIWIYSIIFFILFFLFTGGNVTRIKAARIKKRHRIDGLLYITIRKYYFSKDRRFCCSVTDRMNSTGAKEAYFSPINSIIKYRRKFIEYDRHECHFDL